MAAQFSVSGIKVIAKLSRVRKNPQKFGVVPADEGPSDGGNVAFGGSGDKGDINQK